jgi:actin related protein 2/3 complex, subunit 1A/1B
MIKSLDDPTSSSKGLTPTPTGSRGPGRLNNEAFNIFKAADSRGQSSSSSAVSGGINKGANGELLTVHQNTITDVQPYEWAEDGSVAKFTTIGKDGRLCVWTV